MLGCWTAKGDLLNAEGCAESAKMLFDCMRTTVSRPCSALLHSANVFAAAGARKNAQVHYQLPLGSSEQAAQIKRHYSYTISALFNGAADEWFRPLTF